MRRRTGCSVQRLERPSEEPLHDELLVAGGREGPVEPNASPWAYVAKRQGDIWQKPEGVTDEQLHFMVETMEAWLVADPEALADFYKREFKKNKLPQRTNLEEVSKSDLKAALEAATKDTKKGTYAKSHGFVLVGEIDPKKVRAACPGFAERFFKALEMS